MFSRICCRVTTLLAIAVLPLTAMAESSVKWRSNLDAAKLEAIQSNRLLLIHFWTTTCGPCKVIEQDVFSQPNVGAAVEKEFVPVKIDADVSPALAKAFRIDRVPTEIIMTPQGNVVATLSVPDKPEAYLGQLQNLARHFRQTTGSTGSSGQASINPAYAALPVPKAASTSSAPQPESDPRAAAPGTPQVQTNPYVTAAANPSVHGQAQSVYAAGTPDRYQQSAPAHPPTAPPVQQQVGQQAPSASAVAMQGPTLPANAMPRSYRNPLTDPAKPVGPVAAAVAASATLNSTGPAVIAPPNSAASQGATTPAAQVAATTPGTASPAPPAPNTAVATPEQGAAAAAASAPVIAAPKATLPQLPTGAPPVGFDGCCPVTLKTLKRWAMGDPRFGAIHRGRTYLFAGAAQRDQFIADPDAYSPVFAGLDPVLLLEKQQSTQGSRQYGFEYGGSFYLFSGKETMDRFGANPQSYAAGVRQAMSRIDSSTVGGDIIRR